MEHVEMLVFAVGKPLRRTSGGELAFLRIHESLYGVDGGTLLSIMR